jgi:hypothetical protein
MEYLDQPEFDDTRRAHPAYWRGKAKGLEAILSIVSDIMLGNDDGSGTNNNNDVEAMRRGLLTWRELVNRSLDQDAEKKAEKKIAK